jgi:hypothetical protein
VAPLLQHVFIGQGLSAGKARIADSNRESSEWDTMRRQRVDEILLPYEEGIPLDPCVEMGQGIIDAIRLMVSNNLKCIAVTKNQRPVGMIRLDHAFQKMGLTPLSA